MVGAGCEHADMVRSQTLEAACAVTVVTTEPPLSPRPPHSQRSQQGKTAEMEGGVWPTAAFDFL